MNLLQSFIFKFILLNALVRTTSIKQELSLLLEKDDSLVLDRLSDIFRRTYNTTMPQVSNLHEALQLVFAGDLSQFSTLP